MTKFVALIILILILFQNWNSANSQNINRLKEDIQKVLIGKDATIGVSILGMSPHDSISINGNKRLPMQSVYKFHLAVKVLHEIDKGILNLNDVIKITKEHLNNSLWSVIRKKLPDGGRLTLGEVIKYTIANSDNVGCDILFDKIDGPSFAQVYMQEMGIKEIRIKDNEAAIQNDWELQYENWTTSNSANKALKLFYENQANQLSPKSHAFLWEVMKKSWSGKISMKTYLPEKTVIAHKTGHSGKNDKGVTGAQNDIGIIFLPNGNYFYLSILISNSTEKSEVNKKIIADVSKLAYDYFKNKNG